jgi:hypothetical protein
MLEALWLHTATHLRFFARSRLILGLAVVVGSLWSLGLVAFVLTESSGDRFDMLRTISGQLRWLAWFYTAGMGLFALWWHTSQRTTSLIFTRPGRSEVWLASVFGSAFLVAIVIHAVGFALTLSLSLAWGIPWQTGFLWMSIDGVLESVIMVSVLTGLAATLHPVLAILVVAFFTEGIFRSFDTMLLGYLKSHGDSFWVNAAEHAVRSVYAVLPMLDPFWEKTYEVERSLRVTGTDWMYLGATAAYAAGVFLFWFLFADYRLKRKALS